MSLIKSFQLDTDDIDVDVVLREYKYGIPEHSPIKLSNGKWLHTYKLTRYNDENPTGDEDEEQEVFERELN